MLGSLLKRPIVVSILKTKPIVIDQITGSSKNDDENVSERVEDNNVPSTVTTSKKKSRRKKYPESKQPKKKRRVAGKYFCSVYGCKSRYEM